MKDLLPLLELYTYLHDNPLPDIDEKLEILWHEMINDPNHHILVGITGDKIIYSCILMIPGSKGHVFHACMKKHDLGTRKT